MERFHIDIFILLAYFLLYFVNYLVCYVVHVRAAFGCAYSVDERHLPELTIRKRDNNLPTLGISSLVSNLDAFLAIAEVHINIFQKRVDFKLIPIQKHLHTGEKSGHIVNSFPHQCNDVVVKSLHLESSKFRMESHNSIVFS